MGARGRVFGGAHRAADGACIAALLTLTLLAYSPALFTGRVLLPADIVQLMAPWLAHARERHPEFQFAQNQLHGPIFEYYSWRHYARERIHAGEIPLWNPHELSGNVLLANSQSAVLYPPNALLYLFDLPTGINLVTAFHTFVTGLFLYLLLRAWKLRPEASLTGALVWMFCGLQVAWTEFQTPTATLCWLPAALWTWERYASGGGWRWAVFGTGSAAALTLLAGHLHFAFYVLLALVIYAAFRAAGTPGWKSFGRRMAVLAAALAFGILLAAHTLLPVVEMARMNFRGKSSYRDSISLAMPVENLLTLVLPNLFGNPADYVARDAAGDPTQGWPYWGKFDFIEYAGYLGIPALALAGAAILSLGLRIPMRRGAGVSPSDGTGAFALIAVVGLLLALGTPLCALFYYGVPGYRQFNATGRALSLFCFGMAALAGSGVQTLLHSGADRKGARWGALLLGLSLAVILVAGLIAFPGLRAVHEPLRTDHWTAYALAEWRRLASFALLTGAAAMLALRDRSGRAAWLIPAIAVTDLLAWGARFNPVTDPAMLGGETEVTRFLASTPPDRVLSLEDPERGLKSFIAPNFNAVVGYREVQGADSLHTLRYHRLMLRLLAETAPGATLQDPNTVRIRELGRPGREDMVHPVLNMLNLRYVATTRPPALRRLRRALDAEMGVWENPDRWGAAWMAESVRTVDSSEQMLERLFALDENPVRTAYALRGSPLAAQGAGGSGSARITRFTPHLIEIETGSPSGGLLVVAEPYFPGWRASIRGLPGEARMEPVNYLLRGVAVPAGRRVVELRYEPASFRLGLFLSCIAVSALAGGLVAAVRSRGVRSGA